MAAFEVDWKRDGGQPIGGDKAIDGERAHPSIDVRAGDASKGEDCHWNRHDEADEEDG